MNYTAPFSNTVQRAVCLALSTIIVTLGLLCVTAGAEAVFDRASLLAVTSHRSSHCLAAA